MRMVELPCLLQKVRSCVSKARFNLSPVLRGKLEEIGLELDNKVPLRIHIFLCQGQP